MHQSSPIPTLPRIIYRGYLTRFFEKGIGGTLHNLFNEPFFIKANTRTHGNARKSTQLHAKSTEKARITNIPYSCVLTDRGGLQSLSPCAVPLVHRAFH